MFDSEWVVTHCIVCLYVTSKIFFSVLIKDFYSIPTKVLNQATNIVFYQNKIIESASKDVIIYNGLFYIVKIYSFLKYRILG